jgi:hypothetical protein
MLDELGIAPLARLVAVVTNEEGPRHGRVFRRKRVESGDVVIVGEAIDASTAAGQGTYVAAGFEQDDPAARLG